MKHPRIIQAVFLAVAVVPVILLLANLAFALPLVSKKEAAIPLAFCIALGIGNAMLIERRIKREAVAAAAASKR